MRTVIVTGAAGFIGSHLCEHLMRRGCQVIGIDNFNKYYPPNIKRRNLKKIVDLDRFHLIEGDIRDSALLLDLTQGRKIDTIVHLAARAGVVPSIENPLQTFENNVEGTQSIFEFCRIEEIPKIVAASSSSVYGSRMEGPFREADKTSKPTSPYAATKLMNETMGYSYHEAYGIKMIFLRFFTVYGPRQRPDMAIHAFVRRILMENYLRVYGSPESSRDYTFIDDIISGITAAIELDCEYEIINLGNSAPIKLGELVTTILDVLGKQVDVRWLPEREGNVPMTYADISKAQNLLDYNPTIEIENGIERFVEWFYDIELPRLNK